MPDTIVNTTAVGNGGFPVITALASGGWVIIWETDSARGDLAGQMFNALGERVGSEFIVNTTTSSVQYGPAAGALPDGGFVVAWSDQVGQNSVRSQRYDANGARVGGEVLVSGSAPGDNIYVDLSVAPDGSYIISWESAQVVNSIYQSTPWVARFDSGGNRVGSNVSLPTLVNSDPDIVALSGSLLAVAYATGSSVVASYIDADATGIHIRPPFELAGEHEWANPLGISLVALSNGNIAAAWSYWAYQQGTVGSVTRVFDANGPRAPLVSITSYDYDLGSLQLSALDGGRYATSWGGYEDGGFGSVVRVFDSEGDAIGGAFRINESQSFGNQSAYVAAVGGDRFIAVNGGVNVVARLIDIGRDIVGTSGGDSLSGSATADELRGLDGDDVLDGGNGSDDLHGGNGSDTAIGGGGGDVISGDGGGDMLFGGDGNDRLYAAQAGPDGENYSVPLIIEPGLDSGSEVDVLSGGAGEDSLFAGFGDSVDGGAGLDGLFYSASGAASGVTADFSAAVSGGSTVVGGGTITAIEYLGYFDGSAFDDVVIAGGADAGSPDTVDGSLHGNGGDDHLTAGFIARDLFGGTGNDTLIAVENGYLIGGAGADTLIGGQSNDYLFAGEGDVGFGSFVHGFDGDPEGIIIDNGAEIDTLSGGGGDDTIFAGYGDSADGGSNLPIGPFGGGDTLAISLQASPSGITADFSQTTLSFGGGTFTGFERIDWIIGTDFNDVIGFGAALPSAGRGNQNIYAADGDDIVTAGYYTRYIGGGAGNDILDGRPSTEIGLLSGGDGNDILYQPVAEYTQSNGDAGDDILYDADFSYGGDGNDEIHASIQSNSDSFISGGAGGDRLYGGNSNDLISSGDLVPTQSGLLGTNDLGTERDIIVAGGGDDIVWIGVGDDADGGAGSDRLYLSFFGATAGLTLDTAGLVGATPFTVAGGTVVNFEQLAALVGSQFADTITVSGLNPILFFSLSTGAGNDIVRSTTSGVNFNGGSGDDRFISGPSADFFIGSSGIDTVDYSDYATAVSVNFNTNQGPNNDRFNGVENVDGSAFGDTATGNGSVNVLRGNGGNDILSGQGGNDELIGGSGDDRMDGGTGDDRMTGGSGNDIYIVDSLLDIVTEAAGEGIDEIRTSIRKPVLVANVENLTYTGSGNFSARGNALDNVITGGTGHDVIVGKDGNDSLVGGAGDDLLDGGAGTDSLSGGDGDDLIYIADGSDTVDGGTGRDTIVFYLADIVFASGSSSNVEVFENLSGGNLTAGLTGGDNLFGGSIGIDTIDGAAGDDVLYGRAGNDMLGGGNGSDRLFGMEDNDQLNGGNDTDYLYGDTGDDRLSGDSGDDVLYGDDGSDTLTGGAGYDMLHGGNGGDIFVFASGDSGTSIGTADAIGDFSSAQGDRLDLSEIDAIVGAADDAFTFIGTAAFGTIAGQLRYELIGGNTYVMGDTDGDGGADFMIRVDGAVVLTGADFSL